MTNVDEKLVNTYLNKITEYVDDQQFDILNLTELKTIIYENLLNILEIENESITAYKALVIYISKIDNFTSVTDEDQCAVRRCLFDENDEDMADYSECGECCNNCVTAFFTLKGYEY